eukprot:1564706-Rhodomonas_salina.1
MRGPILTWCEPYYAMSGTHYASPMRCPVLTTRALIPCPVLTTRAMRHVRYCYTACYALSGTEIAYDTPGKSACEQLPAGLCRYPSTPALRRGRYLPTPSLCLVRYLPTPALRHVRYRTTRALRAAREGVGGCGGGEWMSVRERDWTVRGPWVSDDAIVRGGGQDGGDRQGF